MVNSIDMLATIYSLITAILSLFEKNMHKNLGYPETSIFWVTLDIHHFQCQYIGPSYRNGLVHDYNLWKNKLDDHLQFLFHLTDEKHCILHVYVQPGTIIYFHGLLLTHQQLHNHGEVTVEGCCLNFLAYANQKLLCHYISSINCAKRRKINKKNPK